MVNTKKKNDYLRKLASLVGSKYFKTAFMLLHSKLVISSWTVRVQTTKITYVKIEAWMYFVYKGL